VRASLDDLSICFATLDRPYCAQRLIRSIRSHYPEVPILVADQGAPEPEIERFYAAHGVEARFLSADAGVSRCRNILAGSVRTKYLMICDDDFIFSPETDVSGALHILDEDQEVGVVGGKLFDITDLRSLQEAQDRYWECFFFYDPRNGLFLSLPVHAFRPITRMSGPHRYYLCDAVMNFAVLRTAIFTELGHGWDDRFRCNGEHEDFYLALKMNTQVRVAYFPDLVCYHHAPRDVAYTAVRDRQEGWPLFAEKWGIRQYVDREGAWRPHCVMDERQPLLTDASFAREPDFTGRYGQGWKPGLVGVESDGRLYPADPMPGLRHGGAAHERGLVAICRDGGLGEVRSLRPTHAPGSGRHGGRPVLTPTDLSLLRDDVRDGLTLHACPKTAFVAGGLASVLITVENRTGRVIPMGAKAPFDVYFSYHLLRGQGYAVWEGERSRPISDLFDRSMHLLLVRCPDEPGSYTLEVDILVDGLAWASVPTRIACVVAPAEPGAAA